MRSDTSFGTFVYEGWILRCDKNTILVARPTIFKAFCLTFTACARCVVGAQGSECVFVHFGQCPASVTKLTIVAFSSYSRIHWLAPVKVMFLCPASWMLKQVSKDVLQILIREWFHGCNLRYSGGAPISRASAGATISRASAWEAITYNIIKSSMA